MANPVPSVIGVVRRLWPHLRRIRGKPPAAGEDSLPVVDPKMRLTYYDKARWPARDYENKGVKPHG